MSGSGECKLEGLCIKASPLGENDRLITILTDEQGIVRLAVPLSLIHISEPTRPS